MNIVCFHNPNEDNGIYSNWYLSNFTMGNIKFSSMEQYMMYQKAIHFGDNTIADKILATKDVSCIKEYGRQVGNYNDTVWNGIRQIVVFNGLIAKFTQNDDLKQKLLSTGDLVLAECAVHDTIWGIGLSMTDPNRFEITKWHGQNLLGFTLMMVREKLK